MQVLDFARSVILWRIDLDVLPPGTLSHKPPYPMNNSRIQIESRCRVLDQETGSTQTFVLGCDCKTERVGAERDLFLEPNAVFIPFFSDDAFMHLKSFVRAANHAQAYPLSSGEQSYRLPAPTRETVGAAHPDRHERDRE